MARMVPRTEDGAPEGAIDRRWLVARGSGQDIDGLEHCLLLRQVRVGSRGHVVHDEHLALAVDIKDVELVDLARALVEAPLPASEFTDVTVREVMVWAIRLPGDLPPRPELREAFQLPGTPRMTDETPPKNKLPFRGWSPLVGGALAGIALRLIYSGAAGDAYAPMMQSFILASPVLVAVVTVYIAETKSRRTWSYYFLMPALGEYPFRRRHPADSDRRLDLRDPHRPAIRVGWWNRGAGDGSDLPSYSMAAPIHRRLSGVVAIDHRWTRAAPAAAVPGTCRDARNRGCCRRARGVARAHRCAPDRARRNR